MSQSLVDEADGGRAYVPAPTDTRTRLPACLAPAFDTLAIAGKP